MLLPRPRLQRSHRLDDFLVAPEHLALVQLVILEWTVGKQIAQVLLRQKEIAVRQGDAGMQVILQVALLVRLVSVADRSLDSRHYADDWQRPAHPVELKGGVDDANKARNCSPQTLSFDRSRTPTLADYEEVNECFFHMIPRCVQSAGDLNEKDVLEGLEIPSMLPCFFGPRSLGLFCIAGGLWPLFRAECLDE
jgi:hypothetical protein